MAFDIYSPDEYQRHYPDWDGKDFPIEDPPDDTEIMYNQEIQNIAHIQANLVAVFTEWFTSFFEPNYFKFVRIKTQSTFTAFKSFMKDIYKKDKPFLVIDPRPCELVEDSIFAQNMLNRYNMIDPNHDNIGAKLMYSMQIAGTDLFELWYRRNRWRVEFDIMIMEKSLNRQANVHNAMIMNIRHNSKFDLIRHVPVVLPLKHIKNIANFHGKDWESQEFVEFLNRCSKYPIIKRYLSNGQPVFQMQYELHVYVDVPSFPAKDGPENSEAIELGARITDQFIFTADLPSEFLFLTKKELVGKFDRTVEPMPDTISFISPIYRDMPWPEEINGYRLTNRVDIQVQEGDEPKLDAISILKGFDKRIHSIVHEFVHRGGNIDELMKVRVYPNGSMKETGSILHKDGTLELTAPETNRLYTANFYINLKDVNLIREGKNKKYVGDIEKW